MRMNPDRLPSMAYNGRMSTFRARVRPRGRWIDSVRNILQHELTTTRATHIYAIERRLRLPTTLYGMSG